MRRPDERALAARLARILDGRERADGELAVLASVLERAAGPARFEVAATDVDAALVATRTRLPRARSIRRRRMLPAVGLAAAAVAAAVAVVAIVTRTTAIHVEGKALAALGGPSTALRVVERIEPARPGAFPVSVRVGWLDSSGHQRWDQYVGGRRVAETLVERGRVSRYLLADNVLVVGTSCRAFASGCAELVDPIVFYRRALEAGMARTASTVVGERKAYVLTLPVQELPDSVRIEQRVTIDADTYLPLRIEWVESRGQEEPRPFSIIVVKKVARVSHTTAANFLQLVVPSNVRIVQRAAPNRPLRRLAQRRLTLVQARALRPSLRWLGPSHSGLRLTAIEEIRWNAGTAYRLRYGSGLTLWNYGALVPPEIAANRYVPAKTIPVPGGGVVRFYAASGRLVAEREGPDRTAALVGPQLGKEDFYLALEQLRPLR